ncbi:MAG: alginate lyase family protein, partial [Candidatus Kapabacteria bacterium]|nr:alginate lyase family protein [Candidatus Kapabacteria bacterium]
CIYSSLKKALSISPEIAVKKLIGAADRKINLSAYRLNDLEKTTYSTEKYFSGQKLFNYFTIPDKSLLDMHKYLIDIYANNCLDHKFDLLGSGLINNHFKIVMIEQETKQSDNHFKDDSDLKLIVYNLNKYNIPESKKIAENIDKDYKLIDWQIDSKCACFWSKNTWYKDVQYGHIPGPDIKMPWEIGRMQHLPMIAYAYSLSENENKYSDEFRNIVLDFISMNPPRFGTQWMTSMDVGLRAVSMLTAYDMFLSAGVQFDEEFNSVFIRSIYEHGLHIVNNLEWSDGMRGNHYLANISSLVFIALYLPVDNETSQWLAFAVQEMSREIFAQFYKDGGNFEGSMNYHCFSAEMLFYSLALLKALPNEKVDALDNVNIKNFKCKRQLYDNRRQLYKIEDSEIFFSAEFEQMMLKILKFVGKSIKPTGEMPQFGDNDNGRFIKLFPTFSLDQDNNLFEHINNRLSLINLGSLVLNDEKIKSDNMSVEIETDIISKLLSIENTPNSKEYRTYPTDLNKETTCTAFDDLGLFVYKNKNYYLAIRCGANGQNGKGGHDHNDKLSFELNVSGCDFIVDPGTYVYTSYPEKRNLYRSTDMHNTLCIKGLEQNTWETESGDDLFWMNKDVSFPHLFFKDDTYFEAEQCGYGKPHRRSVKFSESSLMFKDICAIQAEKRIMLHLSPGTEIIEQDNGSVRIINNDTQLLISSSDGEFLVEDYQYSPSYGKLIDAKRIVLVSSITEIEWKIEIFQSNKSKGTD